MNMMNVRKSSATFQLCDLLVLVYGDEELKGEVVPMLGTMKCKCMAQTSVTSDVRGLIVSS
jgi:hypothetical protein